MSVGDWQRFRRLSDGTVFGGLRGNVRDPTRLMSFPLRDRPAWANRGVWRSSRRPSDRPLARWLDHQIHMAARFRIGRGLSHPWVADRDRMSGTPQAGARIGAPRRASAVVSRDRTRFPSEPPGYSISAELLDICVVEAGRSASRRRLLVSPIGSAPLSWARRFSSSSFSALIFSERICVSCSCRSQSSSKSMASRSNLRILVAIQVEILVCLTATN